jgi:RNA polymerase sigma-70 factor (ECF subfamily)
MSSGEPSGELSDEAIVRRVCDGETTLFELIVRRHNQRLFRVARAILRDDVEAEDCVQQAYVSAYAHLRTFGHQARFSTWLTRIVMNEARSRVRARRGAEGRLAEEEERMREDWAATVATPEQASSSRELSRLLEVAVDGLPQLYRVVFMMREVQQMSTGDTAACLDLSEEAVKVRLHRAKGLLREALVARVDAAAGEAFPFLGERCDRIVARVMAALPSGAWTTR